MNSLQKVSFLLEECATPTPGQQLLDRFLIGYPRDGMFHRPEVDSVVAHLMLATAPPDFGKRKRDYGLQTRSTVSEALDGADAVVIVPRGPGAVANEDFLESALQAGRPGTACFVHGIPANSAPQARRLAALAQSRKINLLSGTALSVTWRLPDLPPPKSPLAETLVVVQGTFPGAELHALEALAPILESAGHAWDVRACQFLNEASIWRAGQRGLWSWPLLAAALSRTDSPQGDPVKDGRTQDIVGLGLVPKLARQPRGWILTHRDGLRSTILVLDGVVADYNFAARTKSGETHSAQIYRAPAPAEHHYSPLAAVIEDFFRTGKAPWSLDRNLQITRILETMRLPASRSGREFEF